MNTPQTFPGEGGNMAPRSPEQLPEQDPVRKYQRKKKIFRAYQVVWYILGVVEVLLAFRVLLRLVGANPVSGFTSFIYAVSSPFAVPFVGVVPATQAASSVIEWSTLIAMVVYAVVAYGIVKLMQFLKPAEPDVVDQTVDSDI